MIWQIINRRSPLFWMGFHALFGVISTVTPLLLIVWFYLVLLTSLPRLVTKTEGSFAPLLFIITYITSFELPSRMSGTSPYIPYELGKYIFFLLLAFGILKGFRRGILGWVMLLLILPAAFYDFAGETTFKNIVFNLVGPINVALAVVFFRGQDVKKDDVIAAMRLLLYPLISVLAFTIIRTPDLEEVEFTLSANFETAGGFGSNQVSTALGLGAFIVFLFWYNRWTLTGFRWLDILLFTLFVFRGLLTFSRGGMIGGAFGMIVLIAFQLRPAAESFYKATPIKTIFATLTVFLFIAVTFIYADKIAEGNLILRYQGETQGTLAGRKEKTLNVITSNRIQIFSDDFQLWKENPVFGSGVGSSRYLRKKTEGFLSHIEFSRLLSEHGALGLFYIILLLAIGINIYRLRKNVPYGGILVALYVIALFTTFHAAMRTYISPLLFGLSMLTIAYPDTTADEGQT